MKLERQSKMIIGSFGVLALFCIVTTGHAASVDLGGWTFTADLGDEWRTSNETWSFDPDQDIVDPEKATGWEGVGSLPFYLPSFPNAPKDDEFYDSESARVTIYVLKVPEELKKEIKEQNIRVYGSLDKVPESQKEEDLRTMLTDVARFMAAIKGQPPSEKDITLEDRAAHLIERDINADEIQKTQGVIAIALDPDIVGVIDIYGGTSVYKGGVNFDGRAWDILEKFTISRK